MKPFFDSLTHPTLTGEWPNGKNLDASFRSLDEQLDKENFRFALAVGLHDVEDYSHRLFIAACKKYPKLIPIAGYDVHIKNFEQELENIKQLGYKGIKIHPRYSGLNYSDNNLNDVFKYCGSIGLVVMYCTYAHTSLINYPVRDPFYNFVEYAKGCEDTRIILVHGGDVELLKYAELVRFNPNVLLDLSLTMMKYKNSSLDLDISFLFNTFDRRICIGTDHPEYSHKELRERCDFFFKGLSEEKQRNIAYLNLINFFQLRDEG